MRDWVYYLILGGAIVGSAALINWRLSAIEGRLEKFETMFVSTDTFSQAIETAKAQHSDLQHQIDLLKQEKEKH